MFKYYEQSNFTTLDFSSLTKNVILGDLKVGTNEDDGHSQQYQVIEEYLHPQYRNDSSFDLKLLKLNSSVKFDDYIQPACLSQPETTNVSKFLEIGWSRTNIRDNNLLHKVKLTVVSNAICKQTFNRSAHHEQLIDEETIFCAITKKGDREMCQVKD